MNTNDIPCTAASQHLPGIRKAVLVEFEPPTALAPLLAKRAISLLPVAGRPLLQLWVEHLHDAGIEELLVISSRFPEQLRRFLRDGERWGFDKVDYLSTAGLENWQQVMTLTRGLDTSEYVFVMLNALPLAPLVEAGSGPCCWLGTDGVAGAGMASGMAAASQLHFAQINSISDFWRLNMDLLTAQQPSKLMPNSHVSPDARLLAPVFVGARVVLDKGVTLQHAALSSNIDVGEDTVIRHSVVLSDSRIGAQLNLDGVVVDGNLVYAVASDTALYLDDPLLFAPMLAAPVNVGAGQRLLAALLLLLTLPLHLVLRLIHGRELKTLEVPRGRLADNQPQLAQLHVSRLLTPNKAQQRLPWLWQVVVGELPLFGIREVEVGGLLQRPGVISLADFSAQDALSIEVANHYQSKIQSARENLALMLRWLVALAGFEPWVSNN
ncbi:MAG: hypothetical protein NWS96_05335 [Pseudomonadales bacterium]|nr:hypothetical protein [Pseudomonadales bacterium]